MVLARPISGALVHAGRPSLVSDFEQGVRPPSLTFTRGSAAYRVNKSGLLESVGNDVPRFNHDPITGACRGLLIEASRTNLLTYSEELDNAAWTKGDVTISANAAVSPDGATTADKIVEAATTAGHRVIVGGITASGNHTVSVWVKAAERSFAALELWNGTTAVYCLINLSTGALHGSSDVTARVVQYLNGWFHISVVHNLTGSGNSVSLYVANAEGLPTGYAGDGASGIYDWGFQLEAGAFPTSYIKTTNAAVTRAADTATVTLSSDWFNETEGTILCVASHLAPSPAGSDFLWQISDGSNAAYHAMHNPSSPTGQTNVASSPVASISVSGSLANNTRRKLVYSYLANSFQFANSGSLGTEDTAGTLPSGLTTFYLGRHTSGAQIYAHFKRWVYWPRRLDNTVDQALSR